MGYVAIESGKYIYLIFGTCDNSDIVAICNIYYINNYKKGSSITTYFILFGSNHIILYA